MAVKNEIPRAVNQRAKQHSRLYDLRMAKKLSQSKLAKRSGVSRNAIMQIENGDVSPNIGTLKKLSAALDVAVSELLD